MKEIDLIELAKSVWLQKKKVAVWAAIGLALGIVIYVSTPNKYTSTTIVVPETTSKGTSSSMGMMAGMLGMSSALPQGDGVNEKIYPQIFKSSPFLLELANMKVKHQNDSIYFYDYVLNHQKHPWWFYVFNPTEIFASEPKGEFMQSESMKARYTSLLAQMVKVENKKEDGTIVVTSSMQDPGIAVDVTTQLIHNLQKYVTKYRTSKVRNDLKQQEKMLAEARQTYYSTDLLYASALDQNMNLVSQTAHLKINRYKDERDLAFSVYQQLANQVETLKIKIQEETPIATIIEPVSIPFSPSSPNLMLILLGMVFLGAFAAVCQIVFRILVKK